MVINHLPQSSWKKIKINEQELKKGSVKEYESRINNNEREKPFGFFVVVCLQHALLKPFLLHLNKNSKQINIFKV